MDEDSSCDSLDDELPIKLERYHINLDGNGCQIDLEHEGPWKGEDVREVVLTWVQEEETEREYRLWRVCQSLKRGRWKEPHRGIREKKEPHQGDSGFGQYGSKITCTHLSGHDSSCVHVHVQNPTSYIKICKYHFILELHWRSTANVSTPVSVHVALLSNLFGWNLSRPLSVASLMLRLCTASLLSLVLMGCLYPNSTLEKISITTSLLFWDWYHYRRINIASTGPRTPYI